MRLSDCIVCRFFEERVDLKKIWSSENLNKSAYTRLLEERGAFWQFDGDHEKPHVRSNDEYCADGYVDLAVLFNSPPLVDFFAEKLRLKLKEVLEAVRVTRIIGTPGYGALLAHDLARLMDSKSGAPDKDISSQTGMSWREETIFPGENVLQVETLAATALDLKRVKRTLDRDNLYPINWLPYVAVLFVPSFVGSLAFSKKREFIFLSELDMRVWYSDLCPLCAAGSESLVFEDQRDRFKEDRKTIYL